MADKHYKVVWAIDQWAPSPEQAARQARIVQRDPNSTANIFDVRDMEFGDVTEVDLDDINTVRSEDVPPYHLEQDDTDVVDAEFNADDNCILDALVILKRRLKVPGHLFTCPADTRNYLALKCVAMEREHFGVLFLNNRHELLADEFLFSGTIDGATIHPREVVKAALKHNAAAVVLYHNHPSGIPEPSTADQRITTRLKDALALVDVRTLDHIIVGGDKTVSFAERGLL